MATKNYYRVLGVPDTATRQEVQEKYRELAGKFNPKAPFGSQRMFDEITEAYHIILASMPREEKKEEASKQPNYALQRVPVTAKLTAALNLRGINRFIAGTLAGVMLFALSGCGPKPIEKGDMSSGYSLVNDTSWIKDISSTEDYYLIKLDNELHLTKRQIQEYSNGGLMYYRYYDVRTLKFVGMVTELTKYRIGYFEEEFSSSLFDYDYFNGEYAYGKLLPASAVVPLSTFVSSSKPSTEDISYWAGNSESVQMKFDSIVLADMNIHVERNFNKGTASQDFGNPLMHYECTTKNGEVLDFVGYRASHSTEDIGYSFVYNIFDGRIYYIGSNREDAYVSVREEAVEGKHTIDELRSMYGVPFVYEGEPEVGDGEQQDPQVSGEPEASDQLDGDSLESGAVESEPVASEFDWTANAKNIKNYKDVIVLDVANLKIDDMPETVMKEGVNYLFLSLDENGEYVDLFDRYAYISFYGDMTNIFYSGREMAFSSDYMEDISPCLSTFEDFWKSLGKANTLDGSYTFADICKANEEVNPILATRTSPEDLLVVNMSTVDSEVPIYAVMKKDDYSYRNLENYFDFVTYTKGAETATYTNVEKGIYASVLAMPIDDFLRENGLESMIKEAGYTDAEAFEICDQINGRSMLQKAKEMNFN